MNSITPTMNNFFKAVYSQEKLDRPDKKRMKQLAKLSRKKLLELLLKTESDLGFWKGQEQKQQDRCSKISTEMEAQAVAFERALRCINES